jgi:mannose-1-phosphate guanylyltransferase/mannose-1-phosphate guanylyltransferase/mannose-6-phosphate isomerase
MAGGSGTRLWPASNSRLPKQFLPASDKGSFFLMALERALAVTGKNGRVIIITGKAHVPHVVADGAKLNTTDRKRLVVISEPAAKNTAPAIACAVVYSQLAGQDRNMLVLTSDHIINPVTTFKADTDIAASVSKDGKLVIFGIPPSRPETGYGYIETGKAINDVYNVAAFHEKPDQKTAKKYSANKKFFWNSGMFAFNSDFMADEFRLYAPDVISPFEKLRSPELSDYIVTNGVNILKTWKGLETAYNLTKSISFDYAIAEKCKKTVMIRTNFNWIDIGNWEEYVKIRKNNDSQVFNISSESCYVDSDIPVALAGVDDLIVVIRSGKNGEKPSALITRKGETHKVKDIVEQIKKAGKIEIL